MKRAAICLFTFFWIVPGFADCLDFETAWQRVLNSAPSLCAANLEIAAREGEAIQAKITPLPCLEVEAENMGVIGRCKDVEPPQTTVALSQLLEFGGKRRARWEVASSHAGLAFWELQMARQDLKLALWNSFIEVAASEERFILAQQKRVSAEKIVECVSAQVQGGKASPLQEMKVQITLKESCLEEREAYAAFEEAKIGLALLWGSSCPDFDGVFFDFYCFEPPPCCESLLAGIYLTPDYERAQQNVRRAFSVLQLEKANSRPDIVVTGGLRWYNEANRVGVVLGAEMPLTFYNPNFGNVQRAAAERGQASFLLDEAVRVLQQQITFAFEHLQTAYDSSLLICQGLLEDARKAFQWTQECYQAGKFDYREVLEAEQLLYDVQQKFVDVLLDYHIHRAELARLSGGFNE